MAWCKRDVTPVRQHWSYVSFALSHWYHHTLTGTPCKNFSLKTDLAASAIHKYQKVPHACEPLHLTFFLYTFHTKWEGSARIISWNATDSAECCLPEYCRTVNSGASKVKVHITVDVDVVLLVGGFDLAALLAAENIWVKIQYWERMWHILFNFEVPLASESHFIDKQQMLQRILWNIKKSSYRYYYILIVNIIEIHNIFLKITLKCDCAQMLHSDVKKGAPNENLIKIKLTRWDEIMLDNITYNNHLWQNSQVMYLVINSQKISVRCYIKGNAHQQLWSAIQEMQVFRINLTHVFVLF